MDEAWLDDISEFTGAYGTCADPSSAWLADVSSLKVRAERMECRFDSFHFFGPRTDLHTGLSPLSRWKSGIFTTPDGKRFAPNIPSKKIFSTPETRRTGGRVKVTRPIWALRVLVEGAWYCFEHGEVVKSGATRNADALARYLASEIGMPRLGEVTFVACDGPAAKFGLVFSNILLDENVACHIALGLGIDDVFEGTGTMDRPAREASGCELSFAHNP